MDTNLCLSDPDCRCCQRNWSKSVGHIQFDSGYAFSIFSKNIRKFYSNEHQPVNTPTMVKMTATLKSHRCPMHTSKCIGQVLTFLNYVQLKRDHKKRFKRELSVRISWNGFTYWWFSSNWPPQRRQSLCHISIVRPWNHCECSSMWSNFANLKMF